MEMNTIVLRGRVGSEVTLKQEQNAKAYARFRMAVSRSRRTDNGNWQELDVAWYTIKTWGALAQNVMLSLRKGQPIVVVGRPVAQAWKNEDNQVFAGLAVHAVTVGHDQGFGISTFSRLENMAASRERAEEQVDPETGVIEALDGDAPVGAEPGFSTKDDPGDGVVPQGKTSPGDHSAPAADPPF